MEFTWLKKKKIGKKAADQGEKVLLNTKNVNYIAENKE